TGLGKTLTFFAPLLFNNNGIKIIITALNVLGEKNEQELKELGINAINITAATNMQQTFKDIAQGKYRVIITSPEVIMNDSKFQFEWGNDFRPDYADLGRLRWILPSHVHFHVVSATMPDSTLADVKKKLQMKDSETVIIRRSNDRPNVHITVEEMKFSAASAKDVERILRTHVWSVSPPPSFMVFANARRETERGVESAWENLPDDMRKKIIWFHAGMSDKFWRESIERIRKGEVYGGWFTDCGGMGLDIPFIQIIIQFRYVKSLCVLMQRFGRAGRGIGTEACAIYLVEPKYFDCNKTQGAPTGQKRPAKGGQK
ncbi:P-loop containing nucleoside triphosphate hydrolase protein, partial [Coprinopsis marcescibilis]